IDPKTGEYRVYAQKVVVPEVANESREISLPEARLYNHEAKYEDIIEIDVTPNDFGRIAAQNAKQVITQRIREAEREMVFERYSNRIGELVTGTVQQYERGSVILEIGFAEALLPFEEQAKGERFHYGDRLRAVILRVNQTSREAQVVVSRKTPELVKKYLGSVVPTTDNFYATLNSAVFSDGSFVYVPEGVRCPMELSTYFRINAEKTGQFERTLIIADKGAYVSYLEGCTAPMRDENQLHAAVVELVAHKNATIKYSTVQNWYPGDENGKGGIYNFVTKRGICLDANAKISWTQVETGSSITWKYPSVILKGDNTVGEFYSVAVTNNRQQADTGTKMIHLGKNTRSTIVSKGISAGRSNNSYRGLVKVGSKADNARNFSQCDSLLIGDRCGAHTFPYLEVNNKTAKIEHEATTSKIGEDQLFYCHQRGISMENAVALIVNGYCKEVFKELPMEFAVEAQKLLAISLEGSVG
ncbi:Fe-S cluster assembly protein SufB, partial [Cytophagia bacterium CHB2]|nr:Fe-S cluster assembly protein SufB [Cytophagia bacterium CHB2]